MTLKLTCPASEFLFDIENLPSQLIRGIEEFKERNKIVGEIFCKKCFRAHVLKKAKESGIKEEIIIKLKENIGDDVGHYGYYLDDGELIKL